MCRTMLFPWSRFQRRTCRINGSGMAVQWFKRRKFDAVAAFQPTFRSRFLCWRFRLAGIKAAHIKQNRRELQNWYGGNIKFIQSKTPFSALCPYAQSDRLPHPVKFPLPFGKNKGNISSLAPLTGEKNQETWIGIAPFATHVGKIYPLSKQEQILKHLSARDHTKIFLFGGGKKKSKYWKNGPNISPMSSQQPAN